MKAEAFPDRPCIWRCTSCGETLGVKMPGQEPNCWGCGINSDFEEISSPDLLMRLAETTERDTPEAHQFAEMALLAQMRQLDPALAARYDAVYRRATFYWE